MSYLEALKISSQSKFDEGLKMNREGKLVNKGPFEQPKCTICMELHNTKYVLCNASLLDNKL
jgi:hypothetical protein